MIVAGVRPGDEVMCPSFTCMATINAVLLAGGTPRFADIDPQTYNLDPADVEARLTPQTRAIMLVDQIGLPAPYDEFADLCRKRDLILIEDAATALGGRYKGKALGSLGAPAAFSFHPRKMITTGEGGMLMLNDPEWAERARVLRSTGASVSDLARHHAKGTIVQEYHESGFNYRMTDMQAAVGLVQLRKLPEMLAARRLQAGLNDAAQSQMDDLESPYEPGYAEHAYSSYCIRVRPSCPVDAHTIV
jgi:dTDP-4-amino-4,6-dideoxygalactose transaminase